MKQVIIIFFLAALFVGTGYGSAVTKTVGVSDPNYDFPTMAVAFANINAHGLADTVILVLMDSVYN